MFLLVACIVCPSVTVPPPSKTGTNLSLSVFPSYPDETIITWSDPESGKDVAISFQECAGCDRIWRQILEVKDGAGLRGQAEELSPYAGDPDVFLSHRSMIDEYNVTSGGPYDDFGPLGDGHIGGAAPHIDLPSPEMSTLPAIAKILTEASLFQRESLASQLLSHGYIPRLLQCFKTAEDIEDEESLVAAHVAMKAAILLNDTALLEALFTEDIVMDVVGALEHDPEIPPESRISFRKHLAATDALREVVPIKDPNIRAKILQSHRMGFVKDCVLPRSLDDATFATLSSLQLFNNVEVLLALHADPGFFPDLFRRLKETTPGSSSWRDLVGFLQELTSLTRHLQAAQRNALLMQLVGLGMFDIVTDILQSGDRSEARQRAMDVLLAVVAHDPAPLRAYLRGELGDDASPGRDAPALFPHSEKKGPLLFDQLIASMMEQSAGGLQEQALEIMKVLLDPETMESTAEKDRFIDIFYDEHIGGVLAAIVAAGETPLPPTAPKPATIILIIELLCYCVSQHSYRIKYYILRNNVVEKVLRLLHRRERAIAAAALRLLRTCLAMRDEFYNRYLIKNSLLEPVISSFISNGPRYNLLNSAALELFEFIRKENMKGLLGAVVESPQFTELEKQVDYVETFKAMKSRHEINQEGRVGQTSRYSGGLGVPPHAVGHDDHTTRDPLQHTQQQDQRQAEAEAAAIQRAMAAAEARRRRGEREEDADEESYFREDEDEEICEGEQQPPSRGGPSSSSGINIGTGGRVVLESLSPLPGLTAGRLVDYADDDEDEDTLPLNGKLLEIIFIVISRVIDNLAFLFVVIWRSIIADSGTGSKERGSRNS